MALVLNGILEESREYYRKLKRENVGRLLINPRGSLYRKDDGGSSFVYLRRMERGSKRHIYIGRMILTMPPSRSGALHCTARR